MVEIRYGDQFEVTDLAGQTISEARGHFSSEFGIPDKAKAKLNGSKVKSSAELDTVLNDDDKLTFAVSRGKGAYLVGALLLALAVTGGVFAYGWINSTTTISATTSNYNFADVSVNNTVSAWTAHGNTKGDISAGNLFNVTPAPGYGGDLVVSVGFGNAGDLVERYRVLSLQLEMVFSDNLTNVDISAGNGADWVLLNLSNGSVDLFPEIGSANMTVRVKDGFYITQAKGVGAWGGSAAPELFCEVAQR
jgi:molybdopterin converting factor small subunit